MRLKTLFALALLAAPAWVQAVDVSTATGNKISFDSASGVATIEGDAKIESSTATMTADYIEMRSQTKEGHAKGHVRIDQTSATVTGAEADYNWGTSTGTMMDATVVSDPYRISGQKMIQSGPDLFYMEEGRFTTCNEKPPHYHLRSSRAKVIPNKRATMKDARLTFGDLPTFYTPWYTKSLVPKKYTLRIEPGQSGRDGLIVRSWLGYPITEHSYSKFKYDVLQYTGYKWGIEHRYFLPKLNGNFDYEYVRDYNSDPQPESKSYRALWTHYQAITNKLSARANLNIQNTQTFARDYSGLDVSQVRVQDKERGLTSEGEFTYQFTNATVLAKVARKDKFDSDVSSKSFISKTVFPNISLNTTDMDFKHVPFKTSMVATYANETNERLDPSVPLEYTQSASLGPTIKRNFRIGKKWSVTPAAGYLETWKDKAISTAPAGSDIYVGRYSAELTVRHRTFRFMTPTVKYNYTARLKENRLNLDSEADDWGIESNRVTTSFDIYPTQNIFMILASGYNIVDHPRSVPTMFRHESQRILPITFDAQWRVNNKVSLNFSETYTLFNNNRVQRVPLTTGAGIQIGDPLSLTSFEHRFTYSKTAPGEIAQVIFTDRWKFYLTPKWYIDLKLSYLAEGPKSFDYRKVRPIERAISVTRDLHCWLFRMEFSKLPNRGEEVSFYIDLKTNTRAQPNIFNSDADGRYYPYRDYKPDISEIFPTDPTDSSHDHLMP